MNILETELKGVLEIFEEPFSDERGLIWSVFNKHLEKFFSEKNLHFSHLKFNTNKKNVLRGIHFDKYSNKLVRCISGKITQFIIVVDKSSNLFGKYQKFNLEGGDGRSIFIPAGFGNAFVSRENNSTYCYQLSYDGKYPDVNQQQTIHYLDPGLGIDFDVINPILSERDKKL